MKLSQYFFTVEDDELYSMKYLGMLSVLILIYIGNLSNAVFAQSDLPYRDSLVTV